MDINNAGNIGPIVPQNIGDVNANKNIPKTEPEKNEEGGVIRDRVEISREAKTRNEARVNIDTLPEIRGELVEKAIQERVLENQRIPAYLLAARLLFEDNAE